MSEYRTLTAAEINEAMRDYPRPAKKPAAQVSLRLAGIAGCLAGILGILIGRWL